MELSTIIQVRHNNITLTVDIRGRGRGEREGSCVGLGLLTHFYVKLGVYVSIIGIIFFFFYIYFFLFKPSYCIILTDYINIIFYFVNSFNYKNSG